MKTLVKGRSIPMLVVLVITLFATCSDPADEDVTPKEEVETGKITQQGADALSDAISFTSSTKKTGIVPQVNNSSLTRMNGSDTIYIVKGVKMPIRISFPPETPATGMYIHVNNSTYYYDVPVLPEEESDSTGTVYFEIELEDGNDELPKDFPITITPHDDSGSPIDIIERIVEVEETTTPDCPITETGWYWISTTAYNHLGNIFFENFPGKRFKTTTRYDGCCVEGTNQNCSVLSTTLNAEVTAEILYIIMNETFSFYQDGTFVRRTHERKRNFDPIATQWCFSDPGYTYDNSYVTYTGTHDFKPGADRINFLTSQANCDLCGYGSPGGGLIYSCHNMIIIKGSPAEGSTQIRVYKRRFNDQWSD